MCSRAVKPATPVQKLWSLVAAGVAVVHTLGFMQHPQKGCAGRRGRFNNQPQYNSIHAHARCVPHTTGHSVWGKR